jgi:hypothetical protein
MGASMTALAGQPGPESTKESNIDIHRYYRG